MDSVERKSTEVLGAELRKLGPRLLQLAAEETAIARAAVPNLEAVSGARFVRLPTRRWEVFARSA